MEFPVAIVEPLGAVAEVKEDGGNTNELANNAVDTRLRNPWGSICAELVEAEGEHDVEEEHFYDHVGVL